MTHRAQVLVLDPGIDGTGMVLFRVEGESVNDAWLRFNRMTYEPRAKAIVRTGVAAGLTPKAMMPPRLRDLSEKVVAFWRAENAELLPTACIIEFPVIAGMYRRNAKNGRGVQASLDVLYQTIGALACVLESWKVYVEYHPPLKSKKEIKMAAAAEVLARAGRPPERNRDVLDAVALGLNVDLKTVIGGGSGN